MITVYVLEGSKGKRYVGITNNLTRRILEHRSGKTKGGQVIGAFILLHTEEYPDYELARKREKYLKSGQGREYLNSLYPKNGIWNKRTIQRLERACPPQSPTETEAPTETQAGLSAAGGFDSPHL